MMAASVAGQHVWTEKDPKNPSPAENRVFA